MIKTNYLIIGSGVAGLTFAIKIANRFPDRKVTVITKSNEDESNTKYAQGGVAVVLNELEDSFEKHIEDTLIAGAGLCDREVVEMVIKEGPERVKELIEWGARFDKNQNGKFDLGKEGGHSENRVVHYKDHTGFEIERAILHQVHHQQNITVYDHYFAIDLVTSNKKCFGAYVLNQKTNETETFCSDYTLLATGGIGQVYGHSTNPQIATGDGIAMAFRANAEIKDMEFIQFHPTALYDESSRSVFLISEAVRGFGAYLRTISGYRFMLDYDSRAELASRDIVSQSIDLEMKKSGNGFVYLDCKHLDMKDFKKHFPMIYDRCKRIGIDVSNDWIPVVPAQHYLCGGISVDKDGKTTIENLFACGECAHTGLHGANRLASNSLLEALVYSDRIFKYLTEKKLPNEGFQENFDHKKCNERAEVNSEFLTGIRNELQELMRASAGIVREDEILYNASLQLKYWENELGILMKESKCNADLLELYNMIMVGKLIVDSSLARTENCGGFVKKELCYQF